MFNVRNFNMSTKVVINRKTITISKIVNKIIYILPECDGRTVGLLALVSDVYTILPSDPFAYIYFQGSEWTDLIFPNVNLHGQRP